jgi:hypothetical protein
VIDLDGIKARLAAARTEYDPNATEEERDARVERALLADARMHAHAPTDLAALVAEVERTCPGEEKCNGRWLAATLQGATLAPGPHADHPHDWVLRGEDGGPVCDGLSHCPWCGGRLA